MTCPNCQDLERRLEAIRIMHVLGADDIWCNECGFTWPCRTAKALDALSTERLEVQDAALDALVDAARERSYEGHHEYCANSVEGMNGGCKCGHAELVAALAALPTPEKCLHERRLERSLDVVNAAMELRPEDIYVGPRWYALEQALRVWEALDALPDAR